MKNEFFKDTRLLESLEYIDSDLIGEVADRLRVEGTSDKLKGVTPKKSRFRALRQVAALAACALLMGALIPVASYVSGGVANFLAGNGSSGENPATEQPLESANETNVLTVIYDGSEGLEYVVNPDGKSASFIGFGTCTDENVVIASTYNGVPVTEMMNDKRNSGVPLEEAGSVYAKRIIISETIEGIYGGVFESCPNLESIYIGSNVSYIRFFKTYIHELSALTEIEVSPDNKYFFTKGNCLIETQSRTLIHAYGEAVIPDDGTVMTIGGMAFAHYPYKSIVIPESIKTIESQAFYKSSLESVVLPKDLNTLQTHVFSNCDNLISVDFNGYTEIPNGTFSGADKLTEIIGLENVTVIGDHAFSGCMALVSIDLGAGLTEIGQQAFYANWNLTTINFAGTVEQWNAIKKGAGWNTYMNEPEWHEKIPVEFITCSDGVAEQ